VRQVETVIQVLWIERQLQRVETVIQVVVVVAVRMRRVEVDVVVLVLALTPALALVLVLVVVEAVVRWHEIEVFQCRIEHSSFYSLWPLTSSS
jgi:hypothetical protein